MRPARAAWLVVAAANVVAACVQPAGALPGGVSPAPTPTATPTATPTELRSPSPARLAASPPASWRITKPTQAFVPPTSYPAPARPPDYYRSAWYGTAKLWTLLRRDGEVWSGLPHDAHGFGQKTFWWSARFDVNRELQPGIAVEGRRLDAPGHFTQPPPGTNAQADFGSAMLQGIAVPTAGCWRISASYRRATLSYVAWIVG